MTAASEIAVLLIIAVAAFGSLAIAIQWTRHFADWLWIFFHAPKSTGVVTVGAIILIALIIRLIGAIPLDGPLAVSVELILMPFLAVHGANYLAFCIAWRQIGEKPKTFWRSFIFDVRRDAQRDAYEAPRTEQF